MKKFRVRYVHHVEITYDVPVYANNKIEAMRKVEDMHSDVQFTEEEEMDYSGIDMIAKYAEEIEEGEE
jgi:hypothetical protein